WRRWSGGRPGCWRCCRCSESPPAMPPTRPIRSGRYRRQPGRRPSRPAASFGRNAAARGTWETSKTGVVGVTASGWGTEERRWRRSWGGAAPRLPWLAGWGRKGPGRRSARLPSDHGWGLRARLGEEDVEVAALTRDAVVGAEPRLRGHVKAERVAVVL